MGHRQHEQTARLAGAFQTLSEGGIAALRIEPLAARLGVTKGSFYHHFENRRALHMAILGAWEQRGTSEIIEEVEAASLDPVQRIRRLAHQTMHVDPFSDAIETGIRAWAATDATVAASVDELVEMLVGPGDERLAP